MVKSLPAPATSPRHKLKHDHPKPPLHPSPISAHIERNDQPILALNRSNQSHTSSTFSLETQDSLDKDKDFPPPKTDYSNKIQMQSQSQSLSSEYERGRKRGEDGYKWRKYSQRVIKGNENPRNYYKCTFQDCPMKKTVETSLDGLVIDIVYKGSHNHPLPSSSSDDQSVEIDSYLVQEDNNYENDENEPLGKRWKGENEYISMGNRIVIRTTSDIDLLADGYRWKKYGKKAVKGNSNPRTYYKCITEGCPVKKQVVRASDDVKDVITTYEGKHTHDVPVAAGALRRSCSYALNETEADSTQMPIWPPPVSGHSSYSNPFQGATTGPLIRPAPDSGHSSYSNPFQGAMAGPLIRPAPDSGHFSYSNPFQGATAGPFAPQMLIRPAPVSGHSSYSNPFQGATAGPFAPHMLIRPAPVFGHSSYSNPFQGATGGPFPPQMLIRPAPVSGHSSYSNPFQGATAGPFAPQMLIRPAPDSWQSSYSNPFQGAAAGPFTLQMPIRPAPDSGNSSYSNPFQGATAGPLPAPVSGQSSYSNPFQGATAEPFTLQTLNNPIGNDFGYQINQNSVTEKEPTDD